MCQKDILEDIHQTDLAHGVHDGVVEPLDRRRQSPQGHGQLVQGLLGVVGNHDVVAALIVGRDPRNARRSYSYKQG